MVKIKIIIHLFIFHYHLASELSHVNYFVQCVAYQYCLVEAENNDKYNELFETHIYCMIS